MMKSVSVIIPTLNAEATIRSLLTSLVHQDHLPSEIIVVDSSSEDATAEIVAEFKEVDFLKINRADFNHGGTRDFAFRKAHGEYVLFLTQDALPADNSYIDNLLRYFDNPKVAMVSGRQLPRRDAKAAEKLVRFFNYPDKSSIRMAEDIPRLGIKTFFASDVCSAYRADRYLDIGGFENHVATNEDMFIAARFINAGFAVAYAADAEVIHSHNFSFAEQYRRSYLSAEAMEQKKDLLAGVAVSEEGIRMVKFVLGNLLKRGKLFSAFSFCLDCGARLAGTYAGRKRTKVSNTYTRGKTN